MADQRHSELIRCMIGFDAGDPNRIQHFLKVWTFAKVIGEGEQLDEQTQFILETAAIVHDIGIHICEEKYGHTGGRQQEIEGPPIARSMLEIMDYEPDVIERVAWLVGHHHTYTDVKDIDHQILLEADFLVNSFEDQMPEEEIRGFCRKVFRTKTGISLLETQYGIQLREDG